LKSGAQILETASYQLSIENLTKELKCSDLEAKNYIRKSVLIAQESIRELDGQLSQEARVAGSIGPYGACQCDGSEFSGSYANKFSVDVKY
jgi:homocysteine S-methyltransferase